MAKKRFGTFEGVFTPAILSIFGIIMYLRLGWVVGKAGLGGALVIIGIANCITLMTALSMSSIVTNIKIGAGGAYSIIAKSLGVEAGAAIGVPLYLSQAISVAFYITGFTECWVVIFPTHSFQLVAILTWFVLLVISYISARLAFRLQYGVMVIIALSIFSFLLGKNQQPHAIVFMSSASINDFWKAFAIFFPAVTGVLAGAAMSGELKEPRTSIPKGTLSAIAVSFFIYVLFAIWFARMASDQQLIRDTSIILSLVRWKWMVVAGLMGAALSSALSMFVSSPRTLHAMASHRMVPFHTLLVKENKKGEPMAAILFTALLAFLTILFSNLNKIAGLLTMFFLITYMTINLSVFIEQSIGLVSFRPSFKISKFLPFLGSVGSLWVMFHINPEFTFAALLIIGFFYGIFVRKEIKAYFPDVRSGLLMFIAERAANAASRLPYHPKIWKPNLLIPVQDSKDWFGLTSFLRSIVFPNGRILIFGIAALDCATAVKSKEIIEEELSLITDPIREEGILTAKMAAAAPNFRIGATTVIETLKGMFFPPNVLLYSLGSGLEKDNDVKAVLEKAKAEGLGIIIVKHYPEKGFGAGQVINLWIRGKSPNVDLSVLIALQMERNWDGHLRLIQIVDRRDQMQEAYSYLSRIQKMMRIPDDVEIKPLLGSFEEVIANAPAADVNIFGMSEYFDFCWIRRVSERVKTSVLFIRDSKHESAFA